MSIDRFRGDHFYLSNMYVLDVPILAPIGILVPTSEHAYQSAKFVDPKVQRQIAELPAGIETKDIAHELEKSGVALRSDWDIAKIGIMRAIVFNKFYANPNIAKKLVQTGDQELIEGNTWGDRFWGVDPVGSTNGQNNLGKILMGIRSELAINLQDLL